jgi:hypothetical protein
MIMARNRCTSNREVLGKMDISRVSSANFGTNVYTRSFFSLTWRRRVSWIAGNKYMIASVRIVV